MMEIEWQELLSVWGTVYCEANGDALIEKIALEYQIHPFDKGHQANLRDSEVLLRACVKAKLFEFTRPAELQAEAV